MDLSDAEIMTLGRNNAQVQFLLGGGDAEAALEACQASHSLPNFSEARCLYIGAYMDTIDRLRSQMKERT